jgi:IS5 family transposase
MRSQIFTIAWLLVYLGVRINTRTMSFSIYDVERRTAKNTFFKQINILVNWETIGNILSGDYKVGSSATGKPGYEGLLLLKMLLIGIWYDLSDREVEEMVNENLSAMKFCGLQLENEVPDHSVLSRFRTRLTKNRTFEKLLSEINTQLEKHGIIVKSGCKIDATITESERRPKKKTTFEVAQDREEDQVSGADTEKQTAELKLIKCTERGVDAEARFIKKGNRTHFGYKMHAATDENGLILGVVTTAANVHDSQAFGPLLDKIGLPAKSKVYADKAYRSKDNSAALRERKLKNRIHYKATKGKALTIRQKGFNRRVSAFRYTVERTFGGISKWFGGGVARYVGLAKTESQHYLQSICYNLKRAPRLIIEMAVLEQNRKAISA